VDVILGEMLVKSLQKDTEGVQRGIYTRSACSSSPEVPEGPAGPPHYHFPATPPPPLRHSPLIKRGAADSAELKSAWIGEKTDVVLGAELVARLGSYCKILEPGICTRWPMYSLALKK
jgi:hypothetical protein